MLHRFKWLAAGLCLIIQYAALPLIGGAGVYPDLTMDIVCVLGLIYGLDVGLFYGAACGTLIAVMYAAHPLQTVILYGACGILGGLLHGRARASRVALPVVTVTAMHLIKQIAELAVLLIARTRVDFSVAISRVAISTILTALCAIPMYLAFYKNAYKYHVVGKRVGR